MHADQKAKDDLQEIKIQWEKNIQIISERQLSPHDIEVQYVCFDADEAHFLGRYQGYIDNDIMHEANESFRRFRTDLYLAIQKGEQNYRNEMHSQKMRSIEEWGKFLNNIKFNIVSLFLGFIGAYFTFRQLSC
jgi:hypothetical protein